MTLDAKRNGHRNRKTTTNGATLLVLGVRTLPAGRQVFSYYSSGSGGKNSSPPES